MGPCQIPQEEQKDREGEAKVKKEKAISLGGLKGKYESKAIFRLVI